jgi:transposase, IS30 family
MAAPCKITDDLRVVIENLWREGKTCAEIARAISVHPSSVLREIRRNGSGRAGPKNPLGPVRRGLYYRGYLAEWAGRHARARRPRPKRRKLAADTPVRARVAALLQDRFSPQQIARTLRRDHPDRPEMWVSHETIYQALFIQGRGSLRELVDDALRSGRRQRRSQSRAAQAARGAIRGKPWVTEAVHISARPAEVADRAVPGHWEGDLLIGATNDPPSSPWPNAVHASSCSVRFRWTGPAPRSSQ